MTDTDTITITITGYLIDAKAGTIRPVKIDRNNRLKSIYALLKCDCIDMVDLATDHIVYCDDNGLTNGLEYFTELAGFLNPLEGSLLVTGVDSEGDSIAPRCPSKQWLLCLRSTAWCSIRLSNRQTSRMLLVSGSTAFAPASSADVRKS